MLFPLCRGGGMRVFRWFANDCFFYDSLVILFFIVLSFWGARWVTSTRPRISSVLSTCFPHPALFTLILGTYRVQEAVYFMLAGLAKGLSGEAPCWPGTHMRKMYTPPFRWKLITFPVVLLTILPPVLEKVTSLPAAER